MQGGRSGGFEKMSASMMPTQDVERNGSMGKNWGQEGNGPLHAPSGAYVAAGGDPFLPPHHRKKRRGCCRSCSWIIPLFVIANLVMFVISMYVNNCPKNSPDQDCVAQFFGRFSFQSLSENPLLGPSSHTLEKMGALVTSRITNGEGWRLVSCMWLHAGVFHLLVNMLCLVFIGVRLEKEFGFLRVAIVYLLSGFGGSLLSAIFNKNAISVGASGALFGLLGAILSELIVNWTIYGRKCAAFTSLILIVALNLAVGLLPRVDNYAHIGGFISGFLLGFVFLMKPQSGWISKSRFPTGHQVEMPVKSKHNGCQLTLWILALLLLLAGFSVAVVMVVRGYDGNKYCSWCHYLDCVPSSKWSCDNSVSCQYTTGGNTLTVTCLTSNATSSYPGETNPSSSRLTQLCIDVCS